MFPTQAPSLKNQDKFLRVDLTIQKAFYDLTPTKNDPFEKEKK